MDKILKSIYLRLDSTTQSLTKNAISQLLIKIIYANINSISEKEIISAYKNVIGKNKIDEEKVKDCLKQLVDEKSIIRQRGVYHISTNKREKINLSYRESETRKNQIIETFFKPFFSEKDAVAEWFLDSIVSFFRAYSNEWIADLCYKKVFAISSSKENILNVIRNKTLTNKQIDKRDQEELSKKFVNFIATRDPSVDACLWEYGTSSFSAQLITNSIGADEISIGTFNDCKCILDTNILMHIGLESSEYYPAFKSLEEVFQILNVEVGILNITKEEYKNTVGKKRDEILRMVEKYSLEVIKEVDDQYTKTAIARKCYNISDFNRFFGQLLEVPQYIEEKVEIKLFDHDSQLENVIAKSQADEQKQNELNTIFKQITGHDKRQNALIHDVGLIAGVNYLREKEKYFILSQEVSINNYAKQKPSVQDLPISIKLETIINVLAVNNGGVNIDATDYIPLFASIIRNGLTPNKETFKVADLSLMLEKNEQIAQLPSEETIRIAKNVHRKRLLGESEEKIALEITREIQGVKLQIVDDLEETKSKLALEKEEKGRYKESANKSTNALKDKIKRELNKEYGKKIRNKRILFYGVLPVIFSVVSIIGFCLYNMNTNEKAAFWNYVVAVFVNIATNLLIVNLACWPKINELKRNRDNWVEDETESRLRKTLEKS